MCDCVTGLLSQAIHDDTHQKCRDEAMHQSSAISTHWGRAILAGLFVVGLIEPAAAHHVMGGGLPGTFTEGFLSGVGHPIIGLDHLAFVVAVGLAAIALPKRYWLPLAFVGATVVGVVVHLAALDLPAAEVVIALSVALIGALLILGKTGKTALWLSLFAFAGLFHGYAYGESIVGAEPTPLLAYVGGFALIQYAIAVSAMVLVDRMLKTAAVPSLSTRIAGGIVAGIGLVFLSEALLPF